MKEILKKYNGVSLIALVITIVVLIILAAVTVVTLNGDNSIIKRAIGAKNTTTVEQGRERLVLIVNNAIREGNGTLLKENLMTEINGKYQIEDDSQSGWIVTINSNRYHVSTDGNVIIKNN